MKFYAWPLVCISMLTLPAYGLSSDCSRCDVRLILNEREFDCLKSRLPQLRTYKTPYVFFSLSKQQCSGVRDERVRSADTRLPSANTEADRVYRLRRSDVECLMTNLRKVRSTDKRFEVNLVMLCQ